MTCGILTLKTINKKDVQICLTEMGQQFVNKKIISVIELEKMSFKDMKEKDRKELIRLTKKYTEIFKDKVNKYYEQK